MSTTIKPPGGTLVRGIHEWSRFHYDTCEALNWSSLKPWKDNSPRAAHWLEDNQSSDQPYFRFGEQFHCRVLEPERWGLNYIVEPAAWSAGAGHLRKTDSTSKDEAADNREEKAEWLKKAKGKEIIGAEDGAKIEAMAASCYSHPVVKQILSNTWPFRTELACVSELETAGSPDLTEKRIWTKSLMDIELELDAESVDRVFDPGGKLSPGYFEPGVWLGDLKSTSSSVSPGEKSGSWGYSVAKYAYLGQAAWYVDNYERSTGTRPAGFFFIPVCKQEPYECAIYFVTDAQLEAGRKMYQRLLQTRQKCLDAGYFPSYSEYMEPMMVPAWGMR